MRGIIDKKLVLQPKTQKDGKQRSVQLRHDVTMRFRDSMDKKEKLSVSHGYWMWKLNKKNLTFIIRSCCPILNPFKFCQITNFPVTDHLPPYWFCYVEEIMDVVVYNDKLNTNAFSKLKTFTLAINYKS